MSINLGAIPLNAAKNHAKQPAILVNDISISYQELSHQIRACAVALSELGLKTGGSLSLVIGARVVPLNVLFVAEEIQYHLQDSDAKSLIVWDVPEARMGEEGPIVEKRHR